MFLFPIFPETQSLLAQYRDNGFEMLTAKRKINNLLLAPHPELQDDISRTEEVSLGVKKPLGIVIEEVDEEHHEQGVRIISISPQGNAAKSTAPDAYLCIRDKILSINGQLCGTSNFDQVMDLIINAPDDIPVQLTVERPLASPATDASIVSFPNGISIVAKSEEILGALAHESGYGKHILYKCRSGGCGTCEHPVIINGNVHKIKYMRPCVSRIPMKSTRIQVLYPGKV